MAVKALHYYFLVQLKAALRVLVRRTTVFPQYCYILGPLFLLIESLWRSLLLLWFLVHWTLCPLCCFVVFPGQFIARYSYITLICSVLQSFWNTLFLIILKYQILLLWEPSSTYTLFPWLTVLGEFSYNNTFTLQLLELQVIKHFGRWTALTVWFPVPHINSFHEPAEPSKWKQYSASIKNRLLTLSEVPISNYVNEFDREAVNCLEKFPHHHLPQNLALVSVCQ